MRVCRNQQQIPDIEAGFNASMNLATYFREQIEQRRSKLTDDIIGDLVSAEIAGEKLDDDAIITFLRLLLPAGLETTYRSSGNLLYLLLSHPHQLAAVRENLDLIPSAIEEGLRFETPLVTVLRQTTEDVQVGDTVIPAGATVDLCVGSANRDEDRWRTRMSSTSSDPPNRTSRSPPEYTAAWVCTWRAWRPG